MLNKVILIGNLGKDPEVRTLEGGAQVATFSMATSERYTDKDGNKQTVTEWHNVVAWRGLASIAERFLKKGSKVYIEGKLTTRQYQAQDGTNRYVTEVVARELLLMDAKEGGHQSPPPPTQEPAGKPAAAERQHAGPAPEGSEDDLPF